MGTQPLNRLARRCPGALQHLVQRAFQIAIRDSIKALLLGVALTILTR